ncbi:hypothetical protein [Agromyces sp. NPDC058110]|uniref:hypothetical protein n=1 Tax=Agromyces sp. NPDC058110 TaxID=3346345 RepID=UPI0036DB4957
MRSTGHVHTKLGIIGAFISFAMVLSGCADSRVPSPQTVDLYQYALESTPVVITKICAIHNTQTAEAPPFEDSCVPLLRPVSLKSSPIPPIDRTGSTEALDRLAIIGCLNQSDGKVESLGIVNESIAPSGPDPAGSELCDMLPEIRRNAGGSLAEAVWSSGGHEAADAAFQACVGELNGTPDGSNSRPIIGPESISSGAGFWGGTIAETVIDDALGGLTPEQKIATGAALLLVVVPTLGVIAGIAGLSATAAAAVLLVAEVAAGVGVSQLYDGVTSSGTAPSPPKSMPSQAPGGRPDPNAEPAPNSCLEALARLANCMATNHPCEDSEIAAALAAAKARACQSDKVYVDPNSTYCEDEEVTAEQIAKALVLVCANAISDGKPEPGGSPCPLMHAAGVGVFANTLPKICQQVMGGVENCPQLGEPLPSPPEPDCPIGPGPESAQCQAPGGGRGPGGPS